MAGHRSERVAQEIRDEVAVMIGRELKDPRIGFVTVTRVDLTPDLRYARVYVSVLGDKEQQKKTLAGLKQATGFVRREIGKRLRMRLTPEVQFLYDKGIDATDRVARLLDEVNAAPLSEPELAETAEPEDDDE
jgi:ribosome-binding factor A